MVSFSALTLLVRPVKIVPEMTYNVFSGTLSLYTTAASVTLVNCDHKVQCAADIFIPQERAITLLF